MLKGGFHGDTYSGRVEAPVGEWKLANPSRGQNKEVQEDGTRFSSVCDYFESLIFNRRPNRLWLVHVTVHELASMLLTREFFFFIYLHALGKCPEA